MREASVDRGDRGDGGARLRLWLSRRRLLDAAVTALIAGFCSLLGVWVVTLYSVALYWLLHLPIGGPTPLAEGIRVGLSLGFLAILFVWHRLAARRRGAGLRFETGSVLGNEVMKRAPPGACIMERSPAAPKSRRAAAGLAALFLLVGPVLVTAACGQFARAWRLLRMDVQSCARALTVLCERSARVPFEELAREIAHAKPAKMLAQLGDVRGVTFHWTQPAGVSLSEGLRAEIGEATGRAAT